MEPRGNDLKTFSNPLKTFGNKHMYLKMIATTHSYHGEFVFTFSRSGPPCGSISEPGLVLARSETTHVCVHDVRHDMNKESSPFVAGNIGPNSMPDQVSEISGADANPHVLMRCGLGQCVSKDKPMCLDKAVLGQGEGGGEGSCTQMRGYPSESLKCSALSCPEAKHNSVTNTHVIVPTIELFCCRNS